MVKEIVRANPWGSFAAVMIAVVTAFGGYIAAERSSQPNALEIMVSENASLRGEYAGALAQIAELQAQQLGLSMQTQASLAATPRQTIKAFLNSLSSQPAWCKEYYPEDDTIRGMHFNPAYEYFYQVSSKAYVGETDANIWGAMIGAEYEDNDRAVLAKKTSQTMSETVSVAGKKFRVDFWKFHVAVPPKVDLICGIQVRAIRSIQREQNILTDEEKYGAAYYIDRKVFFIEPYSATSMYATR